MPRTPPEGKRFKPGQSGNPLGAALHDPIKKRIKKLTTRELDKVLNLLFLGNLQGLKRIAKNPESQVIEVWLCYVAMHAIKKGDIGPLCALLDRLLGRPKERIEVTSKRSTADLSDEELKKELEKYEKIVNEKPEAPTS
jgi:hypothetical protein